ncbi:MAG: hypothetical protein ACKOXP_03655 [Flavobacteriales bacterium]
MHDKRLHIEQHAIGDALRKPKESSIRAHGKLKGLDVFSWMQPDQTALVNFMESIPTPIIWVGNPAEMEAVLSAHPDLASKIQSMLAYGENRTGFMLENEFVDIQALLNGLMSELKSSGTLLFTCTENDSEYVALKIVAYLNLVQLI